jgi:hypothetical protein
MSRLMAASVGTTDPALAAIFCSCLADESLQTTLPREAARPSHERLSTLRIAGYWGQMRRGDCYVDDRVAFVAFQQKCRTPADYALLAGQPRYLSGIRISCSFVSTTKMARSRAGLVELALALTLWWSPGISVQLSPDL